MRVVSVVVGLCGLGCSGAVPNHSPDARPKDAGGPPTEDADSAGGGDSHDAGEACDPAVDEDGGATTGDGQWHTSIQAAIDASTTGGTVMVCPGTHHGSLVVRDSLTLFSEAGASLVGDGSRPVVTATGGTLVLDGLTLTGGEGLHSAPTPTLEARARGAGVYAADAESLTVRRCTIRDMVSESAVGLLGPVAGPLIVEDTTFTHLESTEGSAALSAYGSSVVLERVEVVDNIGSVVDDAGPTVWLQTSIADVRESLFLGNRGQSTEPSARALGGGLALAVDHALLRDLTFEDNTADVGGGLWIEAVESSMSDVVLFGNTARMDGGGLAVEGRAEDVPQDVTITRTVLEGNVAASLGGGAMVWVEPRTTISLTDVDVMDNTAGEAGGGAWLHGTAADACILSASRVKVADNSAEYSAGLAVWYFSEVELTDGEVSRNTAGIGTGGLELSRTIEATLRRTLVQDNHTMGSGGGVSTYAGDRVQVIDSEVTGNTADGSGGGWLSQGLWDGTFAQQLIFENTLLTDNIAGADGGGLHASEGSVTVSDGVVAANAAGRSGGGAFLDFARLSADGTDWGSGETDNRPHDLATGAQEVESIEGAIRCEEDGTCS